ncbi:glycosyltransferase family 4 protein [Sphaerisporangium aureirubrum]|uniref:Glycosyltransferase family 4 protein n=1 Tax=Sphaerisporangium aureirubrum TaxID=1544736 RepID=A0ABW1NU14_9ACTN
MSGTAVHVVLPGDVDDAAVPSGGNIYDRRVCLGLAALGREVREIPLPGAWPRPEPAGRAELARALAGVPDGGVVLLDGLVACGVPEAVVPHAGRLTLAVLVHLPLADETGLAPAVAAELDAAERETLRVAAAVVATSRWAARRIAEHHGLRPDRVHAVPPGTDPAPLAPGTDGASHLLCVAAVTPRKGHDLLVRALGTLAGLPWTCEFAGSLDRDPAYVAWLRDLVAEHGLTERITLTGPHTGPGLDARYAEADLVVLPSRRETYGMVVTEALARGVPVLTTTADALPSTLGLASGGGVPGMLVPPEDAMALAVAVRRWLGEPDLRHRIRKSAYERRDMLSGWESTSRLLADLLDRLGRRPSL